MLEAECTRCGETFVPHGEEPEDLIHGERNDSDGEHCGGVGVITGEWVLPELCGCENSHCKESHGDGRCLNPAKVGCDYVGGLCQECARHMPEQYLRVTGGNDSFLKR